MEHTTGFHQRVTSLQKHRQMLFPSHFELQKPMAKQWFIHPWSPNASHVRRLSNWDEWSSILERFVKRGCDVIGDVISIDWLVPTNTTGQKKNTYKASSHFALGCIFPCIHHNSRNFVRIIFSDSEGCRRVALSLL